MKRIIIALGIVIMAFTAISADAKTDSRHYTLHKNVLKVNKFNALSLSFPCEIELISKPDSAGVITFFADDEISDRIMFELDGGRLVCKNRRRNENNSFNNMRRRISTVRIFVYGPLDNIIVKGSGGVKSRIPVLADNATLTVNGSGDIDLYNVRIKSLHATVNGSGDIDLKGNTKVPTLVTAVNGSGDIDIENNLTATTITATVNGSGDINFKTVNCTTATVGINGSGDLEIKNLNCTNLNASLNGSGDIDIAGTADTASYSVTSSGDIDCKGMRCKSVTATAHGSGDVYCHASQSLYATAKGSGEIYCYGSPKNVTKNGRSNNIVLR